MADRDFRPGHFNLQGQEGIEVHLPGQDCIQASKFGGSDISTALNVPSGCRTWFKNFKAFEKRPWKFTNIAKSAFGAKSFSRTPVMALFQV